MKNKAWIVWSRTHSHSIFPYSFLSPPFVQAQLHSYTTS
jgi:hypothetical protein